MKIPLLLGTLAALSTLVAATKVLEPLRFGLLTQSCLDKFLSFDLDVACIKSLASKAISYAIIVFSFTLKLPEIKNVLKQKSVEGLNRDALYFEVASYLFTISYNLRVGNPLTVFAETIVIILQNFALVSLFWRFSKYDMGNRVRDSIVFAALIATVAWVPSQYVATFLQFSTAANIWARLKQIYANFSSGTTGVLSPVTVTLQTAGTLARVFTILQETSDTLLVASFGIAFLLNFTILTQVIYYSLSSKKTKAKSDDPKLVQTPKSVSTKRKVSTKAN